MPLVRRQDHPSVSGVGQPVASELLHNRAVGSMTMRIENKGVGPLKFTLFSIHHSPFSASMLAGFFSIRRGTRLS
jgi:hypothetical protein